MAEAAIDRRGGLRRRQAAFELIGRDYRAGPVSYASTAPG
jgi:hypothetical protein